MSTTAIALGLHGCGGSSTPPAPTVSLGASATDVRINGSVTLTWSSTNASSCAASGGSWNGSLGTAGSQAQTLGSTTTYTVTCSGAGGSASAEATVHAWYGPQASISADATDILKNNTVNLSWGASNATSCTGADGLSGPLAISGTQSSPALVSTTTFSVACSNPVYPAVTASVTVTVSSTLTLSLLVQYQVPGDPVLDPSTRYLIPNWTSPVSPPVPYVWVELQDPNGVVVQHTYSDANGVATFSGLDPTTKYTPVIRSKVSDPSLGLDFVVLNNTAPIDTSQPTFRARYAPYSNSGPPYTPASRIASQSMGALIATDGWDATQSKLIDAKRYAGPYALLAAAVKEAQIVSAAVGGASAWRPLTILWSTQNKGGLSTPPDQMDQGLVTGSGGFYSPAHAGVDSSGKTTGPIVTEDFEFISGDQTFEPMDLYPFVLTHEMGHFTQYQFSTIDTPGGEHSYSDFEDPLVAWVEGSASGIAALALGTPHQNRVAMVNGQLVVGIDDPSSYTINGNAQTWPLGWYQEATITRLMWQLYDPNGSLKLSAADVLAPIFSPGWKAGPWLNTAWAYTALLAESSPGNASMIDALADAVKIASTGNDEWGSTESNAGNRSAVDALPPYTTVTIGASPVTLCSAGAPNDYNKESNVRYFRVAGDDASHTLTIQGPTGTVPILDGALFSAGSHALTASALFPSGYSVHSVGDCSVSKSEFSSNTAACNEPATPPAEQCWTVSVK